MTGTYLSLNLLVNPAANIPQTNRERHVTTSLQPHNLQNRLHALYTSAMLQRYNLFVAAGGSSRGKSAVDYLFAQRSSLLVRGRLRAGGRQHQLGTEEYEV